MGVENLVFNRLGNSFSVMLSSEKENVQLWDSVKFNKGSELFAASTIPKMFDNKHIYFTCILKKEETFYGIYFYNRNNVSFFINKDLKDFSSIQNFDLEFEYINDYFQLKNENPELLFKLSMKNLQFLKIQNESILIPKENFFKAVLELF